MASYNVEKEVRALRQGDFLSIGKYFPNVGDSNTKKLVVVNNGIEDIIVQGINVRSGFRGHINKRVNVDLDTEDSNVNIVNKKTGAPNGDPDRKAFTAGDNETGAVSNPDHSFNTKYVPAGTAQSPGATTDAGTNIISPGDNMVIEVTRINTSGQSNLSIDLDYILSEDL